MNQKAWKTETCETCDWYEFPAPTHDGWCCSNPNAPSRAILIGDRCENKKTDRACKYWREARIGKRNYHKALEEFGNKSVEAAQAQTAFGSLARKIEYIKEHIGERCLMCGQVGVAKRVERFLEELARKRDVAKANWDTVEREIKRLRRKIKSLEKEHCEKCCDVN